MLEQSVGAYGPRNGLPLPGTARTIRCKPDLSGIWRGCPHPGHSAPARLGFGGHRLAVIGENSYVWCLAHAAVVNGVGTIVPLDRLLPEDEMLGLLDRGEVDAVFYDAPFHAAMRQGREPAAAAAPSDLPAAGTAEGSERRPIAWSQAAGSADTPATGRRCFLPAGRCSGRRARAVSRPAMTPGSQRENRSRQP